MGELGRDRSDGMGWTGWVALSGLGWVERVCESSGTARLPGVTYGCQTASSRVRSRSALHVCLSVSRPTTRVSPRPACLKDGRTARPFVSFSFPFSSPFSCTCPQRTCPSRSMSAASSPATILRHAASGSASSAAIAGFLKTTRFPAEIAPRTAHCLRPTRFAAPFSSSSTAACVSNTISRLESTWIQRSRSSRSMLAARRRSAGFSVDSQRKTVQENGAPLLPATPLSASFLSSQRACSGDAICGGGGGDGGNSTFAAIFAVDDVDRAPRGTLISWTRD